ncbi:Mth938-like domain-containing protein [Tropicimonas sp.]|uniref:Mth938-like domain-containing protein n=1 Tax=Tropicimonas sp. TaxID=2067044 RepID=UPI003A88CC43
MRVNEVSYTDALPFEGYGPGFFRLGGAVHEGNLIVSDGGIRPWSGLDDAATLTELAGRVDFVLLGTGAEIRPVPSAFRAAVEGAGIGIEPMATPSACRTYNVLLSEGRRMAAAVLAI